MRTNLYLLTLLTFCTLQLSIAQEVTPAQEEEQPNTIERQFEDMLESSNNYQEYKVVRRATLNKLQSNIQDSLNSLRSRMSTFDAQMADRDSEISALNQKLESTQTTLDETRADVASIGFLGIPMTKASYKTLMWVIIGVLTLALIFFIIRYRGSNAHTLEARKKLSETEHEYDDYRKKSLEKEQRLGRQLQDERNKSVKGPKN